MAWAMWSCRSPRLAPRPRWMTWRSSRGSVIDARMAVRGTAAPGATRAPRTAGGGAGGGGGGTGVSLGDGTPVTVGPSVGATLAVGVGDAVGDAVSVGGGDWA